MCRQWSLRFPDTLFPDPNSELHSMIEDVGFMSGLCCGLILGAAAMALIISLLLESEQRKHERDLQRIRKLWE